MPSFDGIGFFKESQMQSKKRNKTISVSCKRLFNDRIVDVRSYVVERAKASGKTLTISVPNKGFQEFDPSDGTILIDKIFKSKRGTEPYKLVSFFWQKEATKARESTPKVEAPQFELPFMKEEQHGNAVAV